MATRSKACATSYADAVITFEKRLVRAEMRAFNLEQINHVLRKENASLQRHKESNRRDKRTIAMLNTRIDGYRQEVRKGYAYKIQKNNIQQTNSRLSKENADLKRHNKQQENSMEIMRACCEEYKKQLEATTRRYERAKVVVSVAKKVARVAKEAHASHAKASRRVAKLEKKCEVQQKLIRGLVRLVRASPHQPSV